MLDHLKAKNRAWASGKVAADPGFFRRLEGQQAPEYLWIGCADSRVPANEIVGLDPGELFVHRNVANLAPPQDANYLSVLQFAVDVLKVRHIHRHDLDAIADPRARLDRLCELNVVRQVKNVASDVFVQEAWGRGQALAVHGWVYALSNGLVTDLGVTVARPEEIDRLG